MKRKHCIREGKHFHSPLVSSLENRKAEMKEEIIHGHSYLHVRDMAKMQMINAGKEKEQKHSELLDHAVIFWSSELY